MHSEFENFEIGKMFARPRPLGFGEALNFASKTDERR